MSWSREKRKNRIGKTQQLCWDCIRATDGSCSWAMHGIPVPHWRAEPDYMERRRRDPERARTWKIFNCPKFRRQYHPMTEAQRMELIVRLEECIRTEHIRAQDVAAELGVGKTAIAHWRHGRKLPDEAHADRLELFLLEHGY